MFKKLKSMFGSSEENAEQQVPEQEAEQQSAVESQEAEAVADVELVKQEITEVESETAQTSESHESEPVEQESNEVDPEVETTSAEESVTEFTAEPETSVKEESEVDKKGFFARIKSGLSKTKENLTEQLGNLFLGAKEIDDDLLEEIETLLLMADVGVEATSEIISRLTDKVARKQLSDAQALQTALKDELASLLHQSEQPLQIDTSKQPYVILMVGVNGVGKTTTIGKLAKKFQSEGKSVMLAAGDTFRAAAVEQLQVWGERNGVPVIAQHTGADSASVIYDAVQSAQAKGVDILIADTAGRLQNKDNLMQELEKVVRVTQKLSPDAPHEVMLVLDAGTGQNALSQAKIFKDSVGVTGITLTKLDGTAKGGVIFAIAKQMDLPIRFIGVGEQIDDLRPFNSQEFVDALFG
ncbi:MAG: signal recognition particle-docking protein FtsY [Neptuniibacter sp.]